jgi:cation transport ATPase
MSRTARLGVVVKGAGTVEALGRARTVLFDKTGTLTVGTPEVREVLSANGVPVGELLRVAASVDRYSAHVLGAALVRAATDADLTLATPTDVREDPGQGIAGTVEGRDVGVGSRAFLRTLDVPQKEIESAAVLSDRGSGEARVTVSVDGHVAGVIVMADEIRADAIRIVDRLRAEGVRHIAGARARSGLRRAHSGAETRRRAANPR